MHNFILQFQFPFQNCTEIGSFQSQDSFQIKAQIFMHDGALQISPGLANLRHADRIV